MANSLLGQPWRVARAYAAACVVAGLVISAALLPIIGPSALLAALLTIPAAALAALLPAGLLILVADRFGLRSVKTYVACGATIGLASMICLTSIGGPPALGELLYFAGTGTVAGALAGYVFYDRTRHGQRG